MKKHSRVYAKINLDAIADNMERMKRHIGEGEQMVAVIKTDGYGHGALPIARMFEKTDDVWGYATACLEEALLLREGGIQKPILVLGCVFPDEYEDMILAKVRPAVYTEDMAREMSKTAVRLGKTVYFHIKLDTGMGRIGFPAKEESFEKSAEIIARICRLPNVKPEGLFTHFAKADETEKTYTYIQHERFVRMKTILEEKGITFPCPSCDNSAGIIDFPQFKHRLARAGISLYGIYPSDEVDKKSVALTPALELISHITYVKDIPPKTPVSYGGTFVSQRQMRIATVPVGYGDGYPRSLSNKGDVLICGKRARILGRICMDQFMVDVTDIPDAKFMDTVTLIGTDGKERISVEELSEKSGRFPYEFLCCLGKRIPRVYFKNGEKIEEKEDFSCHPE